MGWFACPPSSFLSFSFLLSFCHHLSVVISFPELGTSPCPKPTCNMPASCCSRRFDSRPQRRGGGDHDLPRRATPPGGGDRRRPQLRSGPSQNPARRPGGNLVLKLPGTRPGPRRLLMAHVDTVPICRGARPVKKGSTSCRPTSNRPGRRRPHRHLRDPGRRVACLDGKPQHGPLTFLWTVQEEVGLYARVMPRSACSAGQAGLQLRRRAHRQGHDRGHRRLSHGDSRLRHGQPCRRSPERGVRRHHHRWPGHRRPVPRGLAGKIEKPSGSGTANVGVIQGGEATNCHHANCPHPGQSPSHGPALPEQIVRRS